MIPAALRKAQTLLKAGDIAGADKALSARWPGGAEAPAEALYLLGLVRRAQRRLADARTHLTTALAAEPNQARYMFALGEVLAAGGDAQGAADAFEGTLQLEPSFPNAERSFARAALNAGRIGAAEAAARSLIAAAPDADAYDILSCALRAQDRIEEAIAAGEEALRLDPASIPALHDWAVAVGRVGRVEEAVAAFGDLAARGVHASALAFNHGAALVELGRTEEAERLYLEALARWPTDPALHGALAKARWLRGAGADFTELYEQEIARNPDAPLFRVACVDLLRAAGFTERAEAVLQNGLHRRPGDPILLEMRATLAEEAGRVLDALPLLERAAARTDAHEEARARCIRALLKLERADEALARIAPLRAAAPLHQLWIALESLALRQSGDPRYAWLCDYDRMVEAYDLPPPPGYSSIAAFNDALAAALAPLHRAHDHPLGQTLREGTQTTRSLLQADDPIVRTYLDALSEPIRAYTDLMIDPDHPWSGRKTAAFKLSGAWSVRLRANGFHVNHIHPAGWISSSYYVALPAVMAAGEAHAGWIKFGEPPSPIPGCGVEKVVQPKEGRLVLFPSYMWHGTIPFSDGERLTAPFDVVPL